MAVVARAEYSTGRHRVALDAAKAYSRAYSRCRFKRRLDRGDLREMTAAFASARPSDSRTAGPSERSSTTRVANEQRSVWPPARFDGSPPPRLVGYRLLNRGFMKVEACRRSLRGSGSTWRPAGR